jgi:hypothetical protein
VTNYRNTDPPTSKKAGLANVTYRKSQRNRLLVAHIEALLRNPESYFARGLTADEAWLLAGGEIPTVSNYWHRHGDLYKEFDPPLLVPLLNEHGGRLARTGVSGEDRGAYILTPGGMDHGLELRRRWHLTPASAGSNVAVM